MKEKLNLDIKNFRPIHEANIEINKINVIGGVNGSGKSTISKIFYSFLIANSQNRKYFLIREIIDNINYRIDYLNDKLTDEDHVPNCLSCEDDYKKIIKTYDEIYEIIENYEIIVKKRRKELSDTILDCFQDIVNKLDKKGVDVNRLIEWSKNNYILTPKFFNDFYLFIKENNLDDYIYWKRITHEYSELSFFKFTIKLQLIPKELIDYCFSQDNDPTINKKIMEIILVNENFWEFILNRRDKLDFQLNFWVNNYQDNQSDAFDYFAEGFFKNIFYIDNVSILDLEKFNYKAMSLHKSELIENLYFEESQYIAKNHVLDDKVKNILIKLQEIIKGEYSSDSRLFNKEISFNDRDREYFKDEVIIVDINDTIPIQGDEISSGIKQIGIIQLLLLGNKLKNDSYLILDEPEVNLHPDWQFKFAEILVLLAKDLNISVYLNSHSPFFIEAIDAFTEFYDMQEDINYYLTEESEVEGKYDFAKIESDELYKIYDNLGNAYDLINQLRLRKRLEK